MADDQVRAFLNRLSADLELRDRLEQAGDVGALSVTVAADVARNHGFPISPADLIRHQARQLLEEGDKELERTWGRLSGRRSMMLIRRLWEEEDGHATHRGETSLSA